MKVKEGLNWDLEKSRLQFPSWAYAPGRATQQPLGEGPDKV